MARSDEKTKTEILEREIVFTRVFDAPLSLVWKAWTDPEHLPKWWGPKGCTNIVRSIDVRKGGAFRFVMHFDAPQSYDASVHDFDNEILYRDIVPLERLDYTIGDGKGGPQFEASVTFTAMGERTQVVMRSVFPTNEALLAVKKFGAVEGGISTLDCLEDHLGGMKNTTLYLSRIFDAPRSMVFAAWSKPEHLSKWFGPRGFTMPVCEMDFRKGGKYRFNMQWPDGRPNWCEGEYVDVAPDERLAYTARLENEPELRILTTATFEDAGRGKTRVTVRQDYNMEAPATKGAPEGWGQTLDRLAEVLANGL